jgi:hypothetical protein
MRVNGTVALGEEAIAVLDTFIRRCCPIQSIRSTQVVPTSAGLVLLEWR